MTLTQIQAIAAKHGNGDTALEGRLVAAIIQQLNGQNESVPAPATMTPAQARMAHARSCRGKKAVKVATIATPAVKATVKNPDAWRTVKGAGPRQRSAINRYERTLGYKLTTKPMFAAMTKGEASDLLVSLKGE